MNLLPQLIIQEYQLSATDWRVLLNADDPFNCLRYLNFQQFTIFTFGILITQPTSQIVIYGCMMCTQFIFFSANHDILQTFEILTGKYMSHRKKPRGDCLCNTLPQFRDHQCTVNNPRYPHCFVQIPPKQVS